MNASFPSKVFLMSDFVPAIHVLCATDYYMARNTICEVFLTSQFPQDFHTGGAKHVFDGFCGQTQRRGSARYFPPDLHQRRRLPRDFPELQFIAGLSAVIRRVVSRVSTAGAGDGETNPQFQAGFGHCGGWREKFPVLPNCVRFIGRQFPLPPAVQEMAGTET